MLVLVPIKLDCSQSWSETLVFCSGQWSIKRFITVQSMKNKRLSVEPVSHNPNEQGQGTLWKRRKKKTERHQEQKDVEK